MSTLYDLVRFSNNITEKLIENGGELTEEILEILNFTEEQLPKKVDSYATLDERLEKEIEYFKEKEEKIKRIRRAAETLQENIRSRIKICMLNGNLQTIDGVDLLSDSRNLNQGFSSLTLHRSGKSQLRRPSRTKKESRRHLKPAKKSQALV